MAQLLDYPVIDGDQHFREPPGAVQAYLEPRWARRPQGGDSPWDFWLGRMGYWPKDAEEQLAAMDEDSIDVAVFFPTSGLRIGTTIETDYGNALARAHNQWARDFCRIDPDRLKFVAVLAPRDLEESARELCRAVTELGAVGAFVPVHIPQRPDWGKPHWDPLYAECQRLDVPLCFHQPGPTASPGGGEQRFDSFIPSHATAHTFEQMIAVCTVVVGGVLERFPNLRLGFMEAGIGWLPYWMDRLDEEVEKRGDVEAPWLKAKPSEYIMSGRCYFGVETGEKTLPDAIRHAGDDLLLFSSDYPHWDCDWPHTVRRLVERQDIAESSKRKMLHDNVARFYRLAV